MSRSVLRILAVIFVIFDAIGTFVPAAPVWFRWIGRLASPLFLYCMAWSMDKVRNRKKYLKNVYICSVVMALLNLFFSITALFQKVSIAVSTNLFATMFASGILISLYDYVKEHPEEKKKVWKIYWAWQLGGVLIWCVLSEIFGVPTNILQFIFTIFGNMFLAEGAGLMVALGLLFYLTKEKGRVMRFAYFMVSFVFFVNASTGVFGRLLSLLGSDIVLVVVELMTGLSMYGTWVTANFSLDHLLFHDYQWVMLAALPLLMCCRENPKVKERKGAQRHYMTALGYPVAVYFLWFIGNYIL